MSQEYTESEIAEKPVEVTLMSLSRVRDVKAKLTIGKIMGEGESGVVREAKISIDREGKLPWTHSAAIKIYHDAEMGFSMDEGMRHVYNNAYEAQLIYYECLRRAGVHVVPTFRVAMDKQGNALGIVMTNLETQSLTTDADVSSVSTTKIDKPGEVMTYPERARDTKAASGIGISLYQDSWMLQYSSRWKGLGRIIPRSVVSDIIGLKISDKDKFNIFLKKNPDLSEMARKNPILLSETV